MNVYPARARVLAWARAYTAFAAIDFAVVQMLETY